MLFWGSKSRLKATISNTTTPKCRGHTKKCIILADFRVLCDFGAVLFWIVATVSILTGPSLAHRRACTSPWLAGFSPGGCLGRDVLRLVVFVVVAVLGLASGVISIAGLALSHVSWMARVNGLRSSAERVANANHLVDGRWTFERVSSVSVLLVLLLYHSLWPRGWPNEMVRGGRVQRLRRSFNAVFATLPARKRDGVEVNDYCRILCFYQ